MRSQKVSVALLDLANRPHVLYRFFDRTDTLLYVGITVDLGKRLDQHKREKSWWPQVANIQVEHLPGRRDALAAEKDAIRTEKPLYNDQHNELVEAPMLPTPEPPCGEECDDDCRAHHNERCCLSRQDLAIIVIDEVRSQLGGQDERFEEAVAKAKRDLDLPDEDREYRGETDDVPIVARMLVEQVVGDVWRFEYVLENLLDRLDPAVRAQVEQAALSDWNCAGYEKPTRTDLLPDILRHLGYHLSGPPEPSKFDWSQYEDGEVPF